MIEKLDPDQFLLSFFETNLFSSLDATYSNTRQNCILGSKNSLSLYCLNLYDLRSYDVVEQ